MYVRRTTNPPTGVSDMKKSLPIAIKIVLMAVAVAISTFGVVIGESSTVFHKAANVCMECIGIG